MSDMRFTITLRNATDMSQRSLENFRLGLQTETFEMYAAQFGNDGTEVDVQLEDE
jgi:hypothetical protein